MTGVTAIMAGMSSAPLSVTADNVSGVAIAPPSPQTVATVGSPNTTPSGGTAPYSYSWARIGGSTLPTPNSTGIQNPTWDALLTAPQLEVATWRVTVTDAASRTATADITVTLEIS